MDEENPHQEYTHAHRALLQTFIANTTFTFPTVQPVLAAILTMQEQREILDHDITEPDLAAFISTINASISAYDLEIRQTYTQLGQSTNYGDASSNERPNRVRVYALVNTTKDAIAQLATAHTAEEMAFASRVLDDMFDKYNVERGKEIMAITHRQAVRLNKADGNGRTSRLSNVTANGVDGADDTTQAQTQAQKSGLTMPMAEKMLGSLVEEGWFQRTGPRDEPYYILTPRALMELKGWLVETYNEAPDPEALSDDEDGPGRRGIERIKMCAACGDVMLSGQRCADKRCRARLHDACTGPMWRTQRGRRTCPQCQREWDGEHFVGVRAAGVSLGAARTNGAPARGHRPSHGGGGGARQRESNHARRHRAVVDEDDDGDEEEPRPDGRLTGAGFATATSSSTRPTVGRRRTSESVVNGGRRTSNGRGGADTPGEDDDDEDDQ